MCDETTARLEELVEALGDALCRSVGLDPKAELSDTAAAELRAASKGSPLCYAVCYLKYRACRAQGNPKPVCVAQLAECMQQCLK